MTLTDSLALIEFNIGCLIAVSTYWSMPKCKTRTILLKYGIFIAVWGAVGIVGSILWG